MVRIVRSRAIVGGAVALTLGAAALVAAPGAQATAVDPLVTQLLSVANASQAALGPRLDVSTSESINGAFQVLSISDRWVGDFGTGRYRHTVTQGGQFGGSSIDGFNGSAFYATFTPNAEEAAALALLGKPKARIVIDPGDSATAVQMASFAKTETPAAVALSLDPAYGLGTITSITETSVGSTDTYTLVADLQGTTATMTFTAVSGFLTAAHLDAALPTGNAARISSLSRHLSPKSSNTPTAQALAYAGRLSTNGATPHLVEDVKINSHGSGVVVPGAIAGQNVHADFLIAAVNQLRRVAVTGAVSARAKATAASINRWAKKHHRRVTVTDIKALAGVTTSTYALLLIKKGVRIQRTYSAYTGDDLPLGDSSISINSDKGTSGGDLAVSRCIVPSHQKAIVVTC